MSPVYQPAPAVTRPFQEKAWNDMDPEELQTNLMQAIIDDPATNVTNVSVVYHPAEGAITLDNSLSLK